VIGVVGLLTGYGYSAGPHPPSSVDLGRRR
jgi:hypothetical protein